jgi:hypothetical protein
VRRGLRPTTTYEHIVYSHLPGHYFGRSTATHIKNEQFSPLGERSAAALDAEELGQQTPSNNIVIAYLLGQFGRSTATTKKTISSALWVEGGWGPISDAPDTQGHNTNAEDPGQQTPTSTVVISYLLGQFGRCMATAKKTISSALWVVGGWRPNSDAPWTRPQQATAFPENAAPNTPKQPFSTQTSISSLTDLTSFEARNGNLIKTMMGAWRFSAASVLVSVFRQSLPLQSNFRTYTPTAKTACFFDWVFGRSDRDFVSPLSHLSPPPPPAAEFVTHFNSQQNA